MIIAHTVLWTFFFIMSLMCYLMKDNHSGFAGLMTLGWVISLYGILLSVVAGIFKLLATLAGF
jgi:hypothetical protein